MTAGATAREARAAAPHRVVALGASNLTRCLPTLVGLARARWGGDTELLAAVGLGRSYGAARRVLVRRLPGILHCSLWSELERRPAMPTRALITDVGNDILFGFAPEQILAWVSECVARLQATTADIVVTDLPLESLRRISVPEFLFFRSILYPHSRLSLAHLLAAAERVSEGLFDLAARKGLRAVHLERLWYGVDPIHIRPGCWKSAFRSILHGEEDPGGAAGVSLGERLRLYGMRPEREWILGRPRVTPQSGASLPGGGRVWLY
jgi:hypothetical protein